MPTCRPSTASSWSRPIGAGRSFELVAFCPLEAEKITQTQFRWSVENYWADQDIAVVYYNFYGVPE